MSVGSEPFTPVEVTTVQVHVRSHFARLSYKVLA